jgi:hypothetical protein
MAQTRARHYLRFFRYFSFADKTPEQILVETQWATAIVLIGVGLFAHSLLPIFPAAALLVGLHAYSVRRAALSDPDATAEEPVATASAQEKAAPVVGLQDT